MIRKSDFLKSFGSRLRDARQAAGIYQCEIAEHCEVSQELISRIENGQIDVSIRRATEIAARCGTDLTMLLKGLI